MLLCADKTFGQGLLARAGAMARCSLLQYGRMPAFAVRWSQGRVGKDTQRAPDCEAGSGAHRSLLLQLVAVQLVSHVAELPV